MFIRSPRNQLYWADLTSPSQVLEFLSTKEELPPIPWRLEQNGKPLVDQEGTPDLERDSTVHVVPAGGLLGGKGGFGSLLRAIGAQIQKTTNHEAMRDLDGRRQRDINNEKRLRDYVQKEGERKREEGEKKEAKLNKLRRLVDGENVCKHDFHDPDYDKARDEATERVHDAMEAAFASAGDEAVKVNGKRKMEEEEEPKKKKKTGMWMGDGLDDLDDSDLTDSDDDDDSDDKGEKPKPLR